MRGFWHVIESLIAVTILVLFLISIGTTILTRTDIEITQKGFETLKGLDERGVLRNYVTTLDPQGLQDIINISGFNHTIEICSPSGSCIGNQPENPANQFIATYLVSGDDFYTPHIIKLYIYSTPN